MTRLLEYNAAKRGSRFATSTGFVQSHCSPPSSSGHLSPSLGTSSPHKSRCTFLGKWHKDSNAYSRQSGRVMEASVSTFSTAARYVAQPFETSQARNETNASSLEPPLTRCAAAQRSQV